MGLYSYRFSEFIELDKLYPTGLDNDLDAMQSSLRFIQKGAVQHLKKDIEKMEKEMKNDVIIENEVMQSNVDFLEFTSSSNALNIIYNSMLISLFSFLETRLMLLCKLVEPRNSILLNDISGKGIYKYKKYLSKIHSIDFSPKQKEWGLICSYALLRNKLIHSQSVEFNIQSNQKEYNKLKQLEFLTVTESSDTANFHITNQEFLNKFFEIISEFLKFICFVKSPR